MEARSNVLVDRGLYPKRKNPSLSAFSSGNSSSSSSNNNNCFTRSASQQLLHDVPGIGVGGGAGFLVPRPPPNASCPLPAPTHSSLPPSHLLQQPQPPLLPIPLSKSSSLPSPSPPASTGRMVGAAAVRSANKDSRKMKSYPAKSQKDPQFGGTRPQKERAAMTTPVSVPKSAAATAAASPFKDETPEEEDDFIGDVYSLSPPPSSLPMPKFSLRARTNAEAFGGGVLVEGGADVGASDDLRRLLRLS